MNYMPCLTNEIATHIAQRRLKQTFEETSSAAQVPSNNMEKSIIFNHFTNTTFFFCLNTSLDMPPIVTFPELSYLAQHEFYDCKQYYVVEMEVAGSNNNTTGK